MSLTFIHPEVKAMVYTGASITGLALGAIFLASSQSIEILAITILTGVGGSIANSILAAHECIELFTLDVKYHRKELTHRFVRTLNPHLTGIFSGIIEWQTHAVGGLFLALAARAPFPRLSLKISSALIAPCLTAIYIITLVVAHLFARHKKKEQRALLEEAKDFAKLIQDTRSRLKEIETIFTRQKECEGFLELYKSCPREEQRTHAALQAKQTVENSLLTKEVIQELLLEREAAEDLIANGTAMFKDTPLFATIPQNLIPRWMASNTRLIEADTTYKILYAALAIGILAARTGLFSTKGRS